MTDAVFAAIADPNRRTILESLSRQGAATATALAVDLDVSRQAAAKHLHLLRDAGLVTSERIGRETRYLPEPGALTAVTSWVSDVSAAWDRRGAAMRHALQNET